MIFDIIITGNSANCFNSLLKLNYDRKNLSVYICANNYTGNIDNNFFKHVQVTAKNINQVIKQCTSKYIIIFNSEVIVNSQCVKNLSNKITENNKCIAFDFAKQNEEYSNYISPDTFNTEFLHTAGFAALKEALQKCNLQTNNLPQKYADIDLSLQLSRHGKFLYCADITYEYCSNRTEMQNYTDDILGDLQLCYLYGNFKEIIIKNKQYINTVKNPKHFEGVVKALAKNYIKHFLKIFTLLLNRKNRKSINFQNINIDMYDIRGVCKIEPVKGNPLVTVIVRTYKRKESLKKTLAGLCAQTYKNFEVVVVEDGEDLSSDVTNSFKSIMNITHNPTIIPVGRGAAANKGMQLAKGDYICFLDDDDFYYPDYIYTCVSFLTNNINADLVFTSTLAADINVISMQPYKFEIEKITPVIFDHITLMDMCVKCRVPITAGMFKKQLFLQCGGMREDIDADEDWAMWLKFLKIANRANKYEPDIKRALSLCVYPANKEVAKQRMENYEKFDKIMLSDSSLKFVLDISELKEFEKYVKADVLHLFNLGLLNKYIDEQNPLNVQKPNININGKTTLTAMQLNGYKNYLTINYAHELIGN